MTHKNRLEDPTRISPSYNQNITTFSLPYGKDLISFSLTDPCNVHPPKRVKIEWSPSSILKDALNNPLGVGSLKDFVADTRKLLILVNDATRPAPTPAVLVYLHRSIKDHEDLSFLIASGTHPPPDPDGLSRIFGEMLPHYHERISYHQAREEKELIEVGKTSRGTPVSFNRRILESDGIICIGNVKPHYFAGFAGGRKTLLPGAAGYRTIEMNHSHAIHDGSQPMVLKGNPVAEDLEEGVRFLGEKRIFSIQTVVDQDHIIVGAYSGDLHLSFARATDRATEINRIPVSSKGNIVISANPYPMDIDLYQAQHALENVKHMVEKGGILILVSRCWGGAGNQSYMKLLEQGGTREGVQEIIDKGYRLGHHKALRIMKMRDHCELWAVTDLPGEVVERSRMKPYHDLQRAVDEAVNEIIRQGRKPQILVFPQGGMTVPHYTGND